MAGGSGSGDGARAARPRSRGIAGTGPFTLTPEAHDSGHVGKVRVTPGSPLFAASAGPGGGTRDGDHAATSRLGLHGSF